MLSPISQLQAGKDVTLNANRDVNLLSAKNTQYLDGKNESQGGTLGVGIGVGSGGIGLSISASVNKGKGNEKGNGTSYTETTVNAGNQVNITSGRDTNLIGAQVTGESVKADVGRNLLLESQQDSDRYDSKQQNASAGGSFTFGSMTGSGSISLSKDKMHSNYDSVQEQTGIFAGKGGFDVTVGEHTQLNGAVIGSTATADKNKLDTGTLGFKDIHNQADFEVEHQSVGISSGGSIGSQFAGNMANGLLVGANNSGHDSSTTFAAVSDGTLVIRDQDKQTQNVSDLSRDVEHANQTLSPIFDKEKEQKRLQQAQLIGEIGNQAMDIARTEGSIAATKAAKEKMNNVTDADRQAAAAKLAKEKPGKVITEDDINAQIYQTAYNQAFSESGYGTGGKVQQGMQAAVAAVQGLAGGDLKAAIAGGAAPYLAEQIHLLAPNEESRVIAHAVVAGALAELQGKSAAAGAAGAATAALGTKAIAEAMFGTSDFSKMSEEQRQTVSALATLAGGLAGGLASGDTAGAVTGGQSGKNTSENNDQFGFPSGMVSSGQAAFTLGQYMTEHGATAEQITAAQADLARGLGTGAPQPATEFVKAWALLMSGVGGAVIAPTAGTAAVIGGGILGGATDATKQAITIKFKPEEKYSYTDTLIAIGTGALTQGKGFYFSEVVNTSGAYLGSKVKGEDATGAVTGALIGSAIGYKGGEKITNKVISYGVSPVTAEAIGAVSSGVAGTAIGTGIESSFKKDDSKK